MKLKLKIKLKEKEMLECLPIPLEVIDIILEYYNIYKMEHKERFSKTINLINSYPTFIIRINQRTRRGREVYYKFECQNFSYYVIGRQKTYLETFYSVIKLSKIDFFLKNN